jgi:CheY-like chemotaxis protein
MGSLLAGRRILVVEDEVMVAWLLEDSLAAFGCVALGPAVRVGEALEMIEAEAVDAVVLDVNLNGQMSYPVADKLVLRGVPFVFSSGYGRERLAERYRGFPMVQKPYHRSEMRAALEHLFLPRAPYAEGGVSPLAEGAAAIRQRRTGWRDIRARR